MDPPSTIETFPRLTAKMATEATGAHHSGPDVSSGSATHASSTAQSVSLSKHSALPGRFHPHFLDKNRRDIGKHQSKWTASKMETAGSPRREEQRQLPGDQVLDAAPRALAAAHT
jgi:hypothetical protein